MSKITHAEVRQLLNLAADSALESRQQRLLEEHLAGCAECRAYAAELNALETELRATLAARWPDSGLPAPVQTELMEKLKSKPPATSAPANWLWLLLGGSLGLIVLWWLLSKAGQPSTSDETATATITTSASATVTVGGLVSEPTETPTAIVLVAVPLQNVNCREGNGSVFEIADTLMEGERYTPNARGTDNQWLRFLGPAFGQPCWAFVENFNVLLNETLVPLEDVPESVLPFAAYPPTPTPSPTPTFTPEPGAPFVPQCSDGLDNDGDKRTDLADTSCTGPNDNDESN
jgi:hypothetical protein